jgi:hypothetical protein
MNPVYKRSTQRRSAGLQVTNRGNDRVLLGREDIGLPDLKLVCELDFPFHDQSISHD